jgi:hypothetical protein
MRFKEKTPRHRNRGAASQAIHQSRKPGVVMTGASLGAGAAMAGAFLTAAFFLLAVFFPAGFLAFFAGFFAAFFAGRLDFLAAALFAGLAAFFFLVAFFFFFAAMSFTPWFCVRTQKLYAPSRQCASVPVVPNAISFAMRTVPVGDCFLSTNEG